jgi:two-component system chemotaxis response regulator CheB
MEALRILLKGLPPGFAAPILIVQHMSPDSDSFLPAILREQTKLMVKEAETRNASKPAWSMWPRPTTTSWPKRTNPYPCARANESIFSRPSIDVLFESAATPSVPR